MTARQYPIRAPGRLATLGFRIGASLRKVRGIPPTARDIQEAKKVSTERQLAALGIGDASPAFLEFLTSPDTVPKEFR